MAGGTQRITNGQRACVCALSIAGVPMAMACDIAGAPYRRLVQFLPHAWAGRGPKVAPAKLAAIHADWDAGVVSKVIAYRHGMNESAVRRLARRKGWKRRKQPIRWRKLHAIAHGAQVPA